MSRHWLRRSRPFGGAGARDYDGVVIVAHRICGGPRRSWDIGVPAISSVSILRRQEHVEFRLEERAETEFAQDGFVLQRRELSRSRRLLVLK